MMNPKAITFIFILLLFSQCNQKGHECISLEPIPNRNTNGHEVKAVFPYPKYPHFNPNNSDEIIFVNYREDFNPSRLDSTRELVKYNLKTKKSEVLVKKYIDGKPRWGKNDWIIFGLRAKSGRDVIKVRSDGSDLYKVPYTQTIGRFIDPQWDYKEERLLFRTEYNKFLLIDAEDTIVDTLFSGGNIYSSWKHPKYMVSTTYDGLFLSNPYNKQEKEYLYEYERRGAGVDWLDEERVIWCHISGVYVTNIITKETKMIKKTCNADYLQMPTYAPDIDRVIFQRQQIERFNPDAYEGILTKSLYIMKPNGKGGRPLEVY